MSDSQPSLGGRLPLLAPAAFNADQKILHAYLTEKIFPWAEKTGFQSQTTDGKAIGPFNPMLYSPLLSQASLDLTATEQEHTALSKRVREVVILTVGAAWKTPFELYAHTAAGKAVGLDQPTIDAIIAGNTAEALSSEERLAQDFTHRLLTEHQVDQPLYTRMVAAFGEKGLVDMLFLIGGYLTTCVLLNTFAVPVPAADAA